MTAYKNQSDVPMDSFEHARQLGLRVALAYNMNGCTVHCDCTHPRRLVTHDWLEFSRYVQPISEQLVRLDIVTGSNMPHGGLFDITLPALCEFRLEAERSKRLRSPSAVPNTIFSLGVPALRTVHLRDKTIMGVVPAFGQVTTLTLEFTDRCVEPDVLISLESFTNLSDITIIGAMDVDSVDVGPVNWFTKVAWSPITCSPLPSLSLFNVAAEAWGYQSVSLLPIASLRYEELPDDWHNYVDGFLRTILPSTNDSEPLHVLLWTRDQNGLVVAQRHKQTDPHQPILRVLAMPDPQQIDDEPSHALHEPLFEHITTLTIRLDTFIRYDIPAGYHLPFPGPLQTLNLLLDADYHEYYDADEDLSACEECSDALACRCPDRDTLAISDSIPRLEVMSLVGYHTRRILSSEVVWQLFCRMGIFAREAPSSGPTSFILNLCGVIVQNDSKFNDIAGRCSAVNRDLNDIFCSDDIDKWTGPAWSSARL